MKSFLHHIKALLAMLLVVVMMTSCLKEEKETFVLPAIHIEKVDDGDDNGSSTPGGNGGGTSTNPYVDTTGHIADTIIPSELRDSIEDHFDFNEGTNPPSVSGLYVMSPRVMAYHSQQGTTHVTLGDYYFGLLERNGSYLFVTRNGGSTQYSVANVSGNGNDFSVSFIVTGTGSDDMTSSWYRASVVLSGTIEDGGIRNAQYVYTMREKNDPCGLFIPVGTYYVCRDGDGMAVRTSW